MAKTPAPLMDTNIDRVLCENNMVLVYCWSQWCAHCKRLTPLIEELARDYDNGVLVGKLNIEQNRKSAEEYQVMYLPTLLLFKQGKLEESISGIIKKRDVEKMVNKHLQTPAKNKTTPVGRRNAGTS